MQTTQSQKDHYRDLELLPKDIVERQAQSPNLWGKIRAAWVWLVDVLLTDHNLQIWKSEEPDQPPIWYVYNPQSNCLRQFESEYEVVAYLEAYFGIDSAEELYW